MTRPDDLTAEEIRAYLDSQDRGAERSPAHVLAYREAAAVLVAVKDPDRLRPLGSAPAGAAAEFLGRDLIPATGTAFNGQVMLAPEVRAETIRSLSDSGRIEAALAANPAERDSQLQTHFERYLKGDAPPLADQSLSELDATLQVAVWLSGVVEGVPPVQTVEAMAGYQRLLAPLEILAGDAVFRGRRRELEQLRSYVGVRRPESKIEQMSLTEAGWAEPERQPAISIAGIGGAGKSSLVVRLILEHSRADLLRETERIPFGYLDFARASLDVGDPVGLSLELLRQLDLQFPALRLSREFSTLIRSWKSRGTGGSQQEASQQAGQAGVVLADMLGVLGNRLGPRPYVVVLDTFEEVQYRGEERAFPLWGVLSDLQDRWPFLRVVVAGRAPVDSLRLADRPPLQIELGDLDDEAADAFLRAQGIAHRRVRQELISTFGRLPLTLKLISSLASRTEGGAAALTGPRHGFSLVSASDEVIQAELYGRFLDHIADERVRRLAHPGLTLRRINPNLILDVLNEPCGLLIGTIEEATALFEELRRESSLVSVDSDDGDLVHRPDLRRVMLKMVLNGAPMVATEIHQRAATWYERRNGRRDRAEYCYHRLHLGNSADLTNSLFTTTALGDQEVRASIQAAIDEFPVEAQRWLAARGFKVPDQILDQASRNELHAAVTAQIEDLLAYGESSAAEAERVFASVYKSLHEGGLPASSIARSTGGRTARSASPVFRAGARIAAQRGDTDQALSLIEEGLERAAQDGVPELTLGLLKERAWLNRDLPADQQEEGFARLAEHARRHQDLSGRIQHQAQSVRLAPFRIDSFRIMQSLAELHELLGQATPRDVWDLVPALRGPVSLALTVQQKPWSGYGPGPETDTSPLLLAAPLRACVGHELSPFRNAVFPDRRCQAALDNLLGVADLPRVVGGPERTHRSKVFLDLFLLLCDSWPYQILYVAPPIGRRGKRLAVE